MPKSWLDQKHINSCCCTMHAYCCTIHAYCCTMHAYCCTMHAYCCTMHAYCCTMHAYCCTMHAYCCTMHAYLLYHAFYAAFYYPINALWCLTFFEKLLRLSVRLLLNTNPGAGRKLWRQIFHDLAKLYLQPCFQLFLPHAPCGSVGQQMDIFFSFSFFSFTPPTFCFC